MNAYVGKHRPRRFEPPAWLPLSTVPRECPHCVRASVVAYQQRLADIASGLVIP